MLRNEEDYLHFLFLLELPRDALLLARVPSDGLGKARAGVPLFASVLATYEGK